MNPLEQILHSRHREAAQHYRWCVRQLEQRRGDHDAFLNFLVNVVEPARHRCNRVFLEWFERHIAAEPAATAPGREGNSSDIKGRVENR